MLSGALRKQRVAIPANTNEVAVAFPRPVVKLTFRMLPSGDAVSSSQEISYRYAWVSGQCANGGNYFPMKAGEIKQVDKMGGTPPTLYVRNGPNIPATPAILDLEIWEA